ncbi:hypothetical protein [Salinibacter sp. 10B]|uniref:hypothetical protein n=1 Tax=Salinibacter sp. 10B TaxID=1923971 RepID=UPI0011AFE62C|nr:hypothetical protein [Salinibacter sp. 10B]
MTLTRPLLYLFKFPLEQALPSLVMSLRYAHRSFWADRSVTRVLTPLRFEQTVVHSHVDAV